MGQRITQREELSGRNSREGTCAAAAVRPVAKDHEQARLLYEVAGGACGDVKPPENFIVARQVPHDFNIPIVVAPYLSSR